MYKVENQERVRGDVDMGFFVFCYYPARMHARGK